ncbi:YveK family protein [Priestia aryabhattai]|uniref:YveK family protein n=1 Tax=Priestia aryabhattai TaxID=412384 RepID=UPI00203AE118|nr:Wzz/FepE/Etk N-terminal domain-containing protein [Priestia aryabhattai]MCM3253608.1 Wzz/FepE/Etk N-terminal domain-containing protein [Priestia aryabhattai]
MQDIISLKELLQKLKKRWMLITILTVVAGFASGVVSLYMTKPVYQASTQILVNQKNSDSSNLNVNQLQTNIDLVNTYSQIIKSPVILEKVSKKLDLKQSTTALDQKIAVNTQENSQVFSLTVEDTNPATATKIVNTVSKTFQTEIQNIMNVDNVTILSESTLKDNQTPVSPNLLMNIVSALAVGLILGSALAFLLDFIDTTFKNTKEVEEELELPIIGIIPKIPLHREKR